MVVLIGVINWTRRTYASQGRLLFSAIAPLAVLIALGLYQLVPRRKSAVVLFAVPLIAAAAAIPFMTIMPIYAPPSSVSSLPKDAIPVDATFGPIDLVGIKVQSGAVEPGGTLDVTLYWRPTAHTDKNLSFFVQIYGLPDSEGSLQEIGKLNSYPGRGLLQTTIWDTNRIYADTYHIKISEQTQTPVRPKIKVGWWDYESKEIVPPTTREGETLDAVVIDAGRISDGDQRLEDGQKPGAVFAGVLRLNRSLVEQTGEGEMVTVRLEWEALSPVYEDFTVLVHLIDPAHPDQPITHRGRTAAGWTLADFGMGSSKDIYRQTPTLAASRPASGNLPDRRWFLPAN